ncbi:MAG: hypothetical protein H0U71_03385 [Gammaproteobacteria bacterium]|nr:hypothetical protein [Gammaproteobacteria bacterium]
MAIYQFTIELLPRDWAIYHEYNPKSLYDLEQQYDVAEAWEGHHLSNVFDNIISSFLPKGKSWNSRLIIWGDYEHNDIQVWMRNKDQVESITIRLDLRTEIKGLINNIILLAKKLNCVFFVPEIRKIIDPDIFLLHKLIAHSTAVKYVTNPEDYFKKIELKKQGK